jgi:hypothetical protein
MREPIPIACSLSAEDQADRSGEFAAIFDRALIGREATPGGVRLRLRPSPGLRDDLADLVRRERECCPFFDFRMEDRPGELLLEIDAPPEAMPIVDQLFPVGEAR